MKDAVIITGANSDLGVHYIKNAEDKNLTFIALYRDNNEELLKIKESNSVEIQLIRIDLMDTELLKDKINEICSQYCITKVLHLAAPRVKQERFNKVSIDVFNRDYQIQLLSIIEILQIVIPKMKKIKKGKVVIVLTSYTKGVPPKYCSSYVTIKYGLLGLIKSLASEYAGNNIQINGISPSMIKTKFLGDMDERVIEMSIQKNPQKRAVDVSEVVDSINFLLSEKSNFINGNNIVVSGGESF